MSSKVVVLDILTRLKPELMRRYALTYLGVFGSVARDEDGPDSDVDILVDFDWDRADWTVGFPLLRLEDELAACLGRKIDLVTRGGVHPALKPYIMQNAIEIHDD